MLRQMSLLNEEYETLPCLHRLWERKQTRRRRKGKGKGGGEKEYPSNCSKRRRRRRGSKYLLCRLIIKSHPPPSPPPAVVVDASLLSSSSTTTITTLRPILRHRATILHVGTYSWRGGIRGQICSSFPSFFFHHRDWLCPSVGFDTVFHFFDDGNYFSIRRNDIYDNQESPQSVGGCWEEDKEKAEGHRAIIFCCFHKLPLTTFIPLIEATQ